MYLVAISIDIVLRAQRPNDVGRALVAPVGADLDYQVSGGQPIIEF